VFGPDSGFCETVCTLGGQASRVLAWGSNDSPRVIVLLHGTMDAAGTWDLVAPMLAESGAYVLAPDLRGYGRGIRASAASTYHFPDYVLDLAELVRQLPARPLHLVGHSMGGVVASLFTGAFPERVTKLALLEGVGPPDHVAGTVPSRMRAFVEQTLKTRDERERAPMTFAEALQRMKLQHSQIDEAVLATRVPHLLRRVGDEEDAYQWLYDSRHRARSATPFFAASYCEHARAVTCPVLHVGGGITGLHPEDEAARLAHFRNLTEHTLEGAGHMMHWTQPRALADVLLKFLEA
jgi:pimeloyl-ACP methyl ester carboxylesterase